MWNDFACVKLVLLTHSEKYSPLKQFSFSSLSLWKNALEWSSSTLYISSTEECKFSNKNDPSGLFSVDVGGDMPRVIHELARLLAKRCVYFNNKRMYIYICLFNRYKNDITVSRYASKSHQRTPTLYAKQCACIVRARLYACHSDLGRMRPILFYTNVLWGTIHPPCLSFSLWSLLSFLSCCGILKTNKYTLLMMLMMRKIKMLQDILTMMMVIISSYLSFPYHQNNHHHNNSSLLCKREVHLE